MSSWFLVNDQLDAKFFTTYLFQFSTCFEQPRVHRQEKHLYQYYIWYMSLCVGDRFVCRSEGNTYQRLYWYNWFSWRWAWGCSKHVEKWNKYVEKNCASNWSFTYNLYGVIPEGVEKTLLFRPTYLSTIRNTRSAPGITVFLVSIMIQYGETCL